MTLAKTILDRIMGTYAITGGASGIGAALLSSLQAEGHAVINVDIRDADVIADLTTQKGRQAAIAGIIERAEEGLDGFVPVAGIAGGTASGRLISALNYFGTVRLVEGLREALIKKSGAVVLLSSNSAPMEVGGEELVTGLLADNEEAALDMSDDIMEGTHYMLTKRALVFWMQRNAMDYGRDGIRMNAVAPGPVMTPMTEPLFRSQEMAPVMQGLLDATPIHRVAQPEEISAVIEFLLSPASSYVNGSLLFIDGGYDANKRQDRL